MLSNLTLLMIFSFSKYLQIRGMKAENLLQVPFYSIFYSSNFEFLTNFSIYKYMTHFSWAESYLVNLEGEGRGRDFSIQLKLNEWPIVWRQPELSLCFTNDLAPVNLLYKSLNSLEAELVSNRSIVVS